MLSICWVGCFQVACSMSTRSKCIHSVGRTSLLRTDVVLCIRNRHIRFCVWEISRRLYLLAIIITWVTAFIGFDSEIYWIKLNERKSCQKNDIISDDTSVWMLKGKQFECTTTSTAAPKWNKNPKWIWLYKHCSTDTKIHSAHKSFGRCSFERNTTIIINSDYCYYTDNWLHIYTSLTT